MVHRFGDCELDDALFQLRRCGEVVKLEPKVFDLLAYLLRHRHRVVSKDELLDAVWSGQVVSESVLPKCVTAARRACGDTHARKRFIETIHGRGYRFVAEVREQAEPTPAPPPASHALAGAVSAFVGREDTMTRLRAALASAAAGHGAVILLAGEPGIGKTRTADALAAEAEGQGALVAIGRAYEGEGAPAFWPWIQMLRACIPAAGDALLTPAMAASSARIAALIPELRGLVALPSRETAGDERDARFRLFDAVTTFLKDIATRRTVVLLFDDLHWADEASLALLGFFAGEIGAARLLVLATYRDVEVRRTHPLTDTLATLARARGSVRIALRGLPIEETRALIHTLQGEPATDRFVGTVQEMTEGNPFFVQEIVRWLALGESSGALAAADPLPLVLPQSIRDVLGRRLDRLATRTNELLRFASVLGRDFHASALAAMAEIAPSEVLAELAEAVAARVIDELPDAPGRYSFHHALVRQTLYEELGTPERVRLHGKAGAALERLYGDDTTAYLDQLAHHFFQASAGGSAAKAVTFCARAGDIAYRLFAYEQSARHYDRALQALDLAGSRDAAERCELLLALGTARQAAGQRDAARAAFERAADLARRIPRVDLLARAALGYRGPAEMGMPPESTTLALLEEAAAELGSEHPVLRAQLLSRLVGTPPYANSMETRETMSREALALARTHGDGTALRDALSARLWACLGPDRIAERLELARELLGLAERLHNKTMALLAHEAALGAHLLYGDVEAADRALDAYVRAAEELRQPAFLCLATFWKGSRELSRGEFERADALFDRALEMGRDTVPYVSFMWAGQRYTVVYLRDEDDDPKLRSLFFGEMMALPYSWEPAIRSALAFSLLLRGERDAARAEFDRLAEAGFETLRRDEHWLVTLGSLASVAALLGDRERAASLYALLAPYAGLVLVHDLLRSVSGTVDSVLGSLATVLGRHDDGVRHFEAALAKEAAMGAALATIESEVGYAALLTIRDGPGDRARADSLLAAARASMQRLGVRRSWRALVGEPHEGGRSQP